MIALDLQQFQTDIKIKRDESQSYIWDPIRKKYLILQPEELVRQLFLQYLLQVKSYSKNLIRVEKQIKIEDINKRFDLVIYDHKAKPLMLVECKRPKEKITPRVFSQISNYNLVLKVDYLIVTNGHETHCCKMNYKKQNYNFVKDIPSLSELINEK